MKSSRRFVSGVAAIALIVAACGGSDGGGSDGSDGGGSSEPAATTAGSDAGGGDGSGELSLAGFTVGIAVPRTQHFWDNTAFEAAKAEVERLGGEFVGTDGGADPAVHIENHDTFITQEVDAVITILGDDQVDAKLQEVADAGIPVFGIDHGTGPIINNSTSDNFAVGLANGRNVAASINGEGQIAVFNGFTDLEICRIRHEGFIKVIERAFPDIEVVETLDDSEEPFVENGRVKTLDLLQQYPEGELDAIHVSCWDQPTIGVYEALIEEGRTEIKISGVDAGPDAVSLMLEEGSPWDVNVAQQPDQIAIASIQNVARHLAGESVPATSFVPIIEINSKESAQAVFDQLDYAQFVEN